MIPARKQGFRIATLPVATGVSPAGTRLQEPVDATLEQDRSRLRTRLRLPDLFAWATGAAVSAEAHSPSLQQGRHRAPRVRDRFAEILGVGVRIDYLRYVRLAFSKAAPQGQLPAAPARTDATMHVADKTIELLDISYLPGAPGIKVAPGVFLSEVNFPREKMTGTSCGSAERRRSPAGPLLRTGVASNCTARRDA